MRYACMAISAIVLLTYISPATAEESEPLWSFSTSVNASVGDYGTGKDTTLIYVPFTLGVKPIDGFTLGLTVPYIYQTGQTIVITGGGVGVRKDKQRQLGTATQNQVTSTEQGLGDVLLKGQYVLCEEQSVLPEIAPYLRLGPRARHRRVRRDRRCGSEQDAVPAIRQLRHARLHVHRLAGRHEIRQLFRLECGRSLPGRPTVLGIRVS